MARVYRDVEVSVGFGATPTRFINSPLDVMSENNISRILVTFPSEYADYEKIISISYISQDNIRTVEEYTLDYDETLHKYYFLVARKFTFHKDVEIQFRAAYAGDESEQEVVDPAILHLNLKRTLTFDEASGNTGSSGYYVRGYSGYSGYSGQNGISGFSGFSGINGKNASSLTQLFQTWDGSDFYITWDMKTDGDGYIHGLAISDAGTYYYFTNRNKENTTTKKLLPYKVAEISENEPDVENDLTFLTSLENCPPIGKIDVGGNIYDRGMILGFDSSGIPSDLDITRARLFFTVDTIGNNYTQPFTFYGNTTTVQEIETAFSEPVLTLDYSGNTAAFVYEHNPTGGGATNTVGAEWWLGKTESFLNFDLSSLYSSYADYTSRGYELKTASLVLLSIDSWGTSDREIGVYRITYEPGWNDLITWETKPTSETTPFLTFTEAKNESRIPTTYSYDIKDEIIRLVDGSFFNGWSIRYVNDFTPSEEDVWSYYDGVQGYYGGPPKITLTFEKTPTPKTWDEQTCTWTECEPLIKELILGTALVKGSQECRAIDVTDTVKSWVENPRDGVGLYLTTIDEAYNHGYAWFRPWLIGQKYVSSKLCNSGLSGRYPHLEIEYIENNTGIEKWTIKQIFWNGTQTLYSNELLSTVWASLSVSDDGKAHIAFAVKYYTGGVG